MQDPKKEKDPNFSHEFEEQLYWDAYYESYYE